MSNIFERLNDGDDHDSYASRGMDVYVNNGQANVGIFGNHVMPTHKFAVLGSNEKIQAYLRRGTISLLANGYGAPAENQPTQEVQKAKKKKVADSETPVVESSDVNEVQATTEEPKEDSPAVQEQSTEVTDEAENAS
jgi:hypothetical protein